MPFDAPSGGAVAATHDGFARAHPRNWPLILALVACLEVDVALVVLALRVIG